MLVSQLPPESATATALRVEASERPVEASAGVALPADPEREQWSRAEQLLASVRDELHFLRYSYTVAHSAKNKKPKWTPEPLPRPGVKRKKQRDVLNQPQVDTLWAHLQATQQVPDN